MPYSKRSELNIITCKWDQRGLEGMLVMVGLGDLCDLLQSQWFCNSTILWYKTDFNNLQQITHVMCIPCMKYVFLNQYLSLKMILWQSVCLIFKWYPLFHLMFSPKGVVSNKYTSCVNGISWCVSVKAPNEMILHKAQLLQCEGFMSMLPIRQVKKG